MPSVMICGPKVRRELSSTVLWGADVERSFVARREEAAELAATARFDLVVVDSALPGASLLIRELRLGAATRRISIAAMVDRRDFEAADLDLIDAGANAILRPPIGPDWDRRLAPLMHVPPRRAGRFPIELRIETAGLRETTAGTALNLSERGMLVETDVALPLGADVDFRIHLRDAPKPLRGSGQLVRQDTALRGGVCFYALEPHGLARVRRFVRR